MYGVYGALQFKGTAVKNRTEGEKVILEPLEPVEWPERFWDIFRIDPHFGIGAPLATESVDLDGEA